MINRRAVNILLVVVVIAAPSLCLGFPAAKSGYSLEELEKNLFKGRDDGLLFHPWLTLRLFATLESQGIDVPQRYRLLAALGSVEEDWDVDHCSAIPSYAELTRYERLPHYAVVTTRGIANACEFLEKYLGFRLRDVVEHLDDVEMYLRIAALVGIESKRIELMRYTLKDFPHHRAENHFLSSPANEKRGLRESGEWVMVERNVSILEWLSHEDNLCGLPAMRRAVEKREWDSAFRLLGHILHLAEDAGTPAHIRNDSHAPIPHPWEFLKSVFDGLDIDLRGDRSLDWFDPLEKYLTPREDAFSFYDGIVESCGRIPPAEMKGIPLQRAIEDVRSFVAGNFFSRDTVLRDEISGVILDAVPLKKRAFLPATDGSYCLRNRFGDELACTTLEVLKEAGLEKSEEGAFPFAQGSESIRKLLRGGDLDVTNSCIRQSLCRIIPRMDTLLAGYLAHELAGWEFEREDSDE